MAKTAKAAAPKKKVAPAKVAKKAPAKKSSTSKAPVKTSPKSSAVKASAKVAAKTRVKPGSAPKAPAVTKGKTPPKEPPAKSVSVKPALTKATTPQPASAKSGQTKAKEAKTLGGPTSERPDVAARTKKPATLKSEPKPEPMATPSLMSKVPTDEAAEGAAPKKKRSEKDPLAGLDKIADPTARWEALSAKASLIPSVPYRMSESFEPKTGLQHKVLGWGYVLTAQNDRLEVLFKDGVRILISNYKASK